MLNKRLHSLLWIDFRTFCISPKSFETYTETFVTKKELKSKQKLLYIIYVRSRKWFHHFPKVGHDELDFTCTAKRIHNDFKICEIVF
jgi:hypothetical protein